MKNIRDFLKKSGWLRDVDSIQFLAAGEYNENYTVSASGRNYVFRINHDTQLNIGNQIEYEFNVLKSLELSGVTPKPYFYDLHPEELDGGVLLMQYIPGVPLDYGKDSEKAACVFASVHSQPCNDNLILQKQPVYDIARESLWLLNKYKNHPLKDARKRLLSYHDDIIKLAKNTEALFSDEPLCVVNTEVNSKNFIIQKDRGFLVDWEKGVISSRYQDLGHFLVPTTTLWKSDFTFDKEQKKKFLMSYAGYLKKNEVHPLPRVSELLEKTMILEKTILLRALSWCLMAYYEYVEKDRKLKDTTTFERIRMYLREIECFLK
jgi:thiamine kinase-like enzyme